MTVLKVRMKRPLVMAMVLQVALAGWGGGLLAGPLPVNKNTAVLYHFDEGSGTNVYDASSYARDGVFNASLAADGASAWVAGASGYGSAVHLGAVAPDKGRKVEWSGTSMDLAGAEAFSVQMRVKPTQFTKQTRFWAIGDTLGTGCMLNMDPNIVGAQSSISNVSVYWYSGGHRSQIIALTDTLDAGVWQELTLVRRDNAVTNEYNKSWQIWKDGQLIGDSAADYEVIGTSDEFYLGNSELHTWYQNYEGDMDEFRVQREPVYGVPDPNRLPFTVDANTLLLYRFDEGTGTNVADASSYGRDGHFSADLGADGPNAWLASEAGFTNAVHCEGEDTDESRKILWTGTDMGLAGLDAFSVQIRIKPTTFTSGDNFWALGQSLGLCLHLRADDSLVAPASTITKVHVYLYSGTHRDVPIELTEPLEAGVWQELTLVYRSETAVTGRDAAWQIWKDGELIGTSDATYQVAYPAGEVYVAGASAITWHRHYLGDLDEFRIQGEAVYSVPSQGTVMILE